MSIYGLPLILFKGGTEAEMGDIQYLAIKEFDSKRVDVDNSVGVTNSVTETDVVTQTANTGKDMYLGKASISSGLISTASDMDATYKLYLNGAVVEEKIHKAEQNINSSDELEFVTVDKVAAGQIIKITVTNSISTSTSTSISKGKLVLWEEDTGATPAV